MVVLVVLVVVYRWDSRRTEDWKNIEDWNIVGIVGMDIVVVADTEVKNKDKTTKKKNMMNSPHCYYHYYYYYQDVLDCFGYSCCRPGCTGRGNVVDIAVPVVVVAVVVVVVLVVVEAVAAAAVLAAVVALVVAAGIAAAGIAVDMD